jgi:hypothetical protein
LRAYHATTAGLPWVAKLKLRDLPADEARMTKLDRVQVAGWLLMVATVAGVLWTAFGT